ncbi:MAG: hypothetical protein NTZ83_01690 [Candidatus Pacearchaeota archaeon]|nr:hypothetical protein [Candidatus Pacearchaeota archaeon]
MNFRLTKWKVIISLVIVIIIFMLSYAPVICHVGEICLPIYLWLPITALILVYVIWSFVQKKKIVNKIIEVK